MFDKTPTLCFGNTAPIEYLGTSENDQIDGEALLKELNIDKNTNVHGVGSLGIDTALANNNDSDAPSLKWAGTTHDGITGTALSMINSDRRYIYNRMCEVVSTTDNVKTGARTIRYFSVATDDIENDSKSYVGHFYDGSRGGISWNSRWENTAYTRFNDHYYNALVGYQSNKYNSYMELGMACHYIEDLLAPHHAKLVIETPATNHAEYESWVNRQFSSFGTPAMQYESYRFMYDKSTKVIADSFSGAAKASYDLCKNYSFSETKTLIHCAERGITGFLNAYYYKATGLNV